MAKEKKGLKALQVAEEKEYQRKLQEKVDRDNGELQWQYDQERGICNCSHKEKHKEKIAEMDNRREKVPFANSSSDYLYLLYSQYYMTCTHTVRVYVYDDEEEAEKDPD